MAGLRLLFLGAPIVERDGAAVLFDTRKAIALLAYLAVTGRPQRREALATLLWPEYEQANAYASLRRTLWSLKKGIGERRLLIDSETVALQPDGDLWLDVAAFRESLAASAGHAHPNTERCAVCLASLQAAAELYRDDFLAGFTLPDSPPFDEWHFFQTEGLRQELAAVLERLVTIYAARATPAAAIPYARRWLELDPLHEPAHRALIRLYLQTGQRAAALRQYESCVQRLAEELGAAPEPETTQLYQSILVNQLPVRQQQPAPTEPPARAGGIAPTTLSGSTPPEPGTHSAKGRALPAQRTSFIGREREVEALCALLHRPDARLVTLTGPGGSGKTRLAVEVARQILDETSADSEQAFADGVFFVDLAPVGDPELVASTIAGALDVRPSGARPLQESLADFLRARRLLLLLDNFEQIVAAAPLLSELLDAAPHLKLLVTSREILHLYGEWEFSVPPLAVPDPRQMPAGGDGLVRLLRDNEAARLFVERAWAANPGFTLNETNARAVAELCIRLEGLPLAIELAAARSKLFGPQALLARLAGRLDLLAGARDLPARQRTLRGAIQWSYDLLDPAEKLLFACLAVFVGGCTLEAAEQVASYRLKVEGFPSTPEPSTSNLQPSTDPSTFNLQPSAILNGIASLVDKSLLRREESSDGEPRFGMLETIREFALERLGDRGAAEVEALRWEHARYYLGLAEVAEPEIDHLTGADPGAWLARLEVEHDNLRAALDWSLVGGGEDSAQLGLRLAGALRRFWIFRGFVREGRERLVALLAHQGAFARSTARAKALRAAGELAFLQGEYGAARTLVEEGLALSRELGDKSGIARSLASLEGLRWQQGYAGEDSLNEEALALYRELG
ncbi:MAG TPA: BTAD domain-containing putative transcriptional regulator, partial [Ardenticatenaceae bacterium]|nr:BTAD domain-containing putative transcriptional regulator [Ardenticatenaceae bacterium]